MQRIAATFKTVFFGLVPLTFLLAATASAQEPQPAQPASPIAAGPPVSLTTIMAHPDWLGNAPQGAYWSDDGQAIYYSRKRVGERHNDLYRLDLATLKSARLEDAQLGSSDEDDGDWSQDWQRKVYAKDGDVFFKDLVSGVLYQLTRTAGRESNPRFMAGDTQVVFERGDQVLVRDLTSGLEYQPAELLLKDDPAEDKKDSYLHRQQERLFEIVRRNKEREIQERKREKAHRSADPTQVPPPWYLGKGQEIREASLSPRGDRMLVVLGDEDEDDGEAAQMPNYVTDDGRIEIREVRPRVGTGTPAQERLVLLDLTTHTLHELDLAVLPGIDDDPLAELKEAAEAAREAAKQEKAEKIQEEDLDLMGEGPSELDRPDRGESSTASVPAMVPGPAPAAGGAKGGNGGEESDEAELRPLNVRQVIWNDAGTQVALSLFSADHKDRWIATVDLDEGRLVPLHRLTDEGWINWRYNELGWLPGSESLFFLSEETGYSQLYLADLSSAGKPQALTSGDFVVSSPQPDREGAYLYFTANREHPGIYEAYRVNTVGGPIEQMTDLGGQNSARLSPDGSKLLISHSSTTEPVELYVQDNVPGAPAQRATWTISEEFSSMDWVAPEIVAVPSTHQARPIYSRLYLPKTPPAAGPQPAVIFVHGAGYLQNSHQGWSGYFREFMFHTFLTQQGYIVLDMDYRASAGYGREWRTAIYRRMGTPEVEDLAAGVGFLAERYGVDPDRVGVYGGSYGGFLTLMSLFKEPDLFACGAALRLVSDWAHYNHPYTSNILNTPSIDPEAYERSSPIEFADGLEKPLLMCAPMDDNVFFQDTVRLVQRLIELEKEDFEVALYPIEPHGFREPSSWLDEYRRIFKLFERHLKD